MPDVAVFFHTFPTQQSFVQRVLAGGVKEHGVASTTPPTLTAAALSATVVRITASRSVLNTGIVGVPGTYSFLGPTAITATAVAVSGTNVDLTVSGEMRQGGSYTLVVPGNTVFAVDGVPNAPASLPFTGIGVSPTIATLQAVDATTLRVIYSEAVNEADALTAANYVISSPALAVTAVKKETDLVYLLTTAKQTPGQSYTLTISNVRDTSGNLI